jgi:hypothetical protein
MSMWAGWLAALVLAQADAAVPDRGDDGSAPGRRPSSAPKTTSTMPFLTGATGEQTEPQAAWDGKQFLATWRSSLWQNELRAARLGPRTARCWIPGAWRSRNWSGPTATPRFAAGPDGFLLAWVREPSALTVARVLAPEGGPLQILPPLVISPWARFDALGLEPVAGVVRGQYWMLWTQSGTQPGLFLARMDRDGRPGAPPVRPGRWPRDSRRPCACPRRPPTACTRVFAVPAGAWWTCGLLRLDAQGQPLEAGGRTLWQLPAWPSRGSAGGGRIAAAAAVAVIGADGKSQVRTTRPTWKDRGTWMVAAGAAGDRGSRCAVVCPHGHLESGRRSG